MSETARAEVVVVGGGPAGIAAACRTAESGADVLLVDEGPAIGGQIWRPGGRGRRPPEAPRWLDRLARSGARSMSGIGVLDAHPDGTLLAEVEDSRIEIKSDAVVVATGARELFLPFPGWTLPGVVGVGAVQALLKSGARFAGRRVVLAGSGPLLLPVAAALRQNGATLVALAEQAPAQSLLGFAASLWRFPGKALEALRYRLGALGVRYRSGVWASRALGSERLTEVELTNGRRVWSESCDLLGCSYGLVPNLELAGRLGCEVADGRVVVDDHQQTTIEGVYCAGEPTGVGGAELAVVEGEIAAAAITGQTNRMPTLAARRRRLRRFAASMERAFRPRRELADRLTPETTICRCEDVGWDALDPRWSPRQAKLYTRTGMGPCQGRVCGPALQFLCGWGSDSVRPPLKPCRVASLISPPSG